MNYEEKYKEMKARVLEIGRGYVKGVDFSKPRQIAEYIDPELCESEDKKNIKNLIDELKCSLRAANCQNDACGGGHEKRIALLEWAISWLEKQGEQKPVECIKLDNEFENQVSHLIAFVLNGEHEYNEGFVKYASQSLLGFAKKEQKPADKVEPKFKVGDLITNGILVGKIYEIHELGYHAYFGDHYADVPDAENWHKWTIKDAKDGDVLSYVTDEGDLWIMIYWSLYKPYEGHVHYHALLVNDNFSDKGTCCICIDNLKPATKEQRDLLFQKMKEAGYEFDAEKKELKEIEQASAWSEWDTKELDSVFSSAKHVLTDDNKKWLKSLKDRVQSRSKQEWSKEDEHCIELLLPIIDSSSLIPKNRKKCKNFLKSLKPNHWKPSEEQMEALFEAKLASTKNREYFLGLLYEDLEKL